MLEQMAPKYFSFYFCLNELPGDLNIINHIWKHVCKCVHLYMWGITRRSLILQSISLCQLYSNKKIKYILHMIF